MVALASCFSVLASCDRLLDTKAMRERDLNKNRNELTDTAIIRRERSRHRLRIETAETFHFNAAAFRLDRELGIPEHIAVENNLTVRPKWPDVIFDRYD